MQRQWVIWFLLSGIASVFSNPCDVKEVTNCYEDLLNYESLLFPLYGSDKARLDDTCGNINASFSCIRSFASSCHSSPECDEECQDLVGDIRVFITNSGLDKFSEDLCPEESPLRATYLENVACLERNADAYASCHNDSQRSLQYLSTVQHAHAIEARCCYSRWYDQCFTNITRDNCNENATMFVSYAIHKLVGNIIEMLCAKTEIHCDRPPLPPEEGEEEEGYDPDHTGNELDHDKPDQTENEIDNEIKDEMKKKSTSTGTIHFSLTSVIILSYFSAVLCKYIL